MSGWSKDALNRSCKNARYDDVLIDATGNAYQAVAADTGSALSPNVIRCVDSIRLVDLKAKRRRNVTCQMKSVRKLA